MQKPKRTVTKTTGKEKSLGRRRVLRCKGKRAQSGSAAIEFALIAPVLLILIMGVLEVGLMFFSQFLLKNATIAAAREIRTGNVTTLTSASALASYICDTSDSTIGKLAASLMLPSCNAKLTSGSGGGIYVKAFGTSFSYFSSTDFTTALNASAVKSNGTFNTNFDNPNTPCTIVLLRVSYAWDVVTPVLTWFLVNLPATNQHVLTATEVFRNEPGTAICS